MDGVFVVIGLIIGLGGALFYGYLFGDAFRSWNEGKSYDDKKKSNSQGSSKTLLIGLAIFFFIALIITQFGSEP